jgi:SNF2 family DNA or RNA helicase
VSSAKIDKMMDILEEVIEAADDGEKVLIFSQWTSLLDLAEVPIEGKGWGYRRYDGSMNAKMRGDAVDDFKDTRKNVRIMLVSLKAGNAGLNLNIASRVIILDPFWNPYVEEQAIDRAHRIGQVRPVKVHRVLVEETVEDRIIELQDKKRALIEEALDEKEHQNISRLGVQELAYLFGVTRSATDRVQYQERRRGQ